MSDFSFLNVNHKFRFYVFESLAYRGLYIKTEYNVGMRLTDINSRELFTGLKSNIAILDNNSSYDFLQQILSSTCIYQFLTFRTTWKEKILKGNATEMFWSVTTTGGENGGTDISVTSSGTQRTLTSFACKCKGKRIGNKLTVFLVADSNSSISCSSSVSQSVTHSLRFCDIISNIA